MKIEKTCRYGHGPLTEATDLWSLPLVKSVQLDGDGASGFLMDTNVVWTCAILHCTTCGYMELEDRDL